MNLSTKCEVCKKDMGSLRSLHGHLKAHKMVMMEYYTTYFPRKNLYTGDQIPFKNVDQYFSTDFSNMPQMYKWLGLQPAEASKKYCLKKLKERLTKKHFKFAPCHVDLQTSKTPSIDQYKMYCGSYSEACKSLGADLRFTKNIPKDFFEGEDSGEKIMVDTREQLPIKFKNSIEMKLDFGDYALYGDNYNYLKRQL